MQLEAKRPPRAAPASLSRSPEKLASTMTQIPNNRAIPTQQAALARKGEVPLVSPLDIAYKKAEDSMEEALFLGQQEDFLRYKKEGAACNILFIFDSLLVVILPIYA